MGFLDDLGKSLNKVGKKTSEMANVAKLKLDITKYKSTIDKKYEELGSRIYFLNKEGVEMDESVTTLITEIDELFVQIKVVESEIEKINKEVPKAAEGPLVCASCGEELPEGTKFCGSCGNKVEEEVEAAPTVEIKKCPNCGAEVGEAKFCNSCGTSIE